VELIFYPPITDPNTALIIKPIKRKKMTHSQINPTKAGSFQKER